MRRCLAHRIRHAPRRARRGAALYTIVASVSLLVAILGLSALNVLRIERRTSATANHVVAARLAAISAAEMAIRDLQRDPEWRSRYQHNVEAGNVTLGQADASWKLRDDDGSLVDDAWDSVEVCGIGRCGQAVWVESVLMEAIPVEVGPSELRAYSNQSSLSTAVVDNTGWWAQYFKPTLPARALSWRMVQVQIYAERMSSNPEHSVIVAAELPDGDWKPTGQIIEQQAVTATSWPESYNWQAIEFSSNSGLDRDSGVCLTLKTTQDDVIRFPYRNASSGQADSALMTSSGGAWQSPVAGQCILYKVSGMYTIAEMKVVPGTWKRTSL